MGEADLRKKDAPDISSVVATLDYFYPLSEGIKDYFKKRYPYALTFF